MKFSRTAIQGVSVVETTLFTDHRGVFSRLFCESDLAEVIGTRHIVQINHSTTKAIGAIRGLHYQFTPHAEMKLVRCIRGRVWDVAVDLRKGSSTFLQWHAEELAAENARMLVIPEGCAHGFQVLEPNSELMYLSTSLYTPEAEGGVAYDDPSFAISWPLPVTDLSVRDEQHPHLTATFIGITP